MERKFYLDALSMTKPNNGPKLKIETGANDIDIDKFFSEIKNYKAEFAFSLMSTLEDEPQDSGKRQTLSEKVGNSELYFSSIRLHQGVTMAKKLPKPKLAVAGPGAGKTHEMVNEIVAAIQDASSHRFLAAITYTNAAANTIRERLSRRIRLRRNIFIGTTHSFVNRFVLAPCAELLLDSP